MTDHGPYDVVVIGSGIGGLTAAALLARGGRTVCVIERNRSLGGAASVFKVGDLTIEASLHETTDPRDPSDPKHAILARLGLLDAVDWVPVPVFQTISGGPVGAPLALRHGFERVADTLAERFPAAATGTRRLLHRFARVQETLARLAAAEAHRSIGGLLAAAPGLLPIAADWRMTLADAFSRDLGDAEGVKCALAANLPYFHDDPREMWWLHFAVAQGGYLGAGGVYVRGGSTMLSRALAQSIKTDGGTILLGRTAVEIEIGRDGAPIAVHHAAHDGSGPVRIEAGAVLANAAPPAVAAMLPEDARSRFEAAFTGRAPSISLFSACFGLATPPQAFGLEAYSSILLPDWMQRLDDYALAGELLGAPPGGRLPPLTVVNYGAIDARLAEGGPTLVSVTGVDRIGNWSGRERDEEEARRAAWLDAIQGELERRYPGFAAAVTTRILLSARSMRDYLGTPDGAVYGFRPVPPRRSLLAGPPHGPRTPVPGLVLASSFAGVGGFTGAMRAGAEAAGLVERGRRPG